MRKSIMGSGTLACVLVAMTALSCASGSSAARPPKTASPQAAPTSAGVRAVDAIALANRLAAHGRTTSSPLALLAAAQILIDSPPQPLGVSAERRFRGAPTQRGNKIGTPVMFDPAQLILAAQSMGAGNQGVSTLASELQQRLGMRARGAVNGPRITVGEVLAGSFDVYRIAFRGNEPAIAQIDGDGDTDLDCVAYDSNDRIVAIDDNLTDTCVLSWWPSSTQTYRIEIENLGEVFNAYTLVTN